LKALEDANESVSDSIALVLEFVTMRENLARRNEFKREAVANIEKAIRAAFPDYTVFSTVDGVRLALKKGWLLTKESGTHIRVTVEGESLKAARDIKKRGKTLVMKYVVDGKE